jgi:hypothetical protein
MFKTGFVLMVGLLASPGFAQEEESPLTEEEMAQARKGTLELDTIEVNATITVQQEAALRIVRQAMSEPRSLKRKDFDRWRCWLDRPVGTHLNYLHCARNGDLWALKPKGNGAFLNGQDLIPIKYGDYGEVLVSDRPVNRAKLEKILAGLSGDGANDFMFVNMVLNGEKPPRDVPSDGELDQFARAWARVKALEQEGRDEGAQVQAIERTGLSLDRYNRIAELVEDHAYIHDQVAARLQKING